MADSDLGRIDGRTKLIGLTATPIGHSLSPKMHNLAFRKLGLNYAYMAFEVGNQQLPDVVKGFRALNIRGWNVSMPNKTKILPLLDELTPAAKFAGAVNTVVNENGKLVGNITDGTGFVAGLKDEGFEIKGKKMTLLGAGGAATAIAIQCALDGAAEVNIFNQDDDFYARAVKNADIINTEIKNGCKATVNRLEDLDALKASVADADLLTDATSLGMKPLVGQNAIPDASWLRPELVVADTVYSPAKTALLEMAESAGCKAINGLGMMLYQGARAFEIWTGQKMPVDYIKEQMF